MKLLKNFKGGVHPNYEKQHSEDKPIQVLPAPEVVVMPLQQHVGAPCDPVVKKGDQVLMGQVIGESSYAISAPVHSSVSGTVLAVEPRPSVTGRSVMSVVIQNDGQDTPIEEQQNPILKSSDPNQRIDVDGNLIRQAINAAGVVGLGGGAFPTAVKVTPPDTSHIEYLLINGSECEPYLTADQRVMEEYPDKVILGAKLLAKAAGAEKIIIAIESNKPEAIKILEKYAVPNEIEVITVVTKYPAGGERMLIKAVLNREVPSGGYPHEVGVLVHNVSTAWAVAETCLTGRPLIERVITVTGPGIKEPGNYLVRIGTPFKNIVEAAGGFNGQPERVLCGGPMMGLAQFNLDVPVVKATSGVLILTEKEAQKYEPLPCIKCARCVDVCPVYLMPLKLEAFAMNEMWEQAEEYGAMDCIECGCCTYICPSKRYLVHYIRLAKQEIIAARGKN